MINIFKSINRSFDKNIKTKENQIRKIRVYIICKHKVILFKFNYNYLKNIENIKLIAI